MSVFHFKDCMGDRHSVEIDFDPEAHKTAKQAARAFREALSRCPLAYDYPEGAGMTNTYLLREQERGERHRRYIVGMEGPGGIWGRMNS